MVDRHRSMNQARVQISRRRQTTRRARLAWLLWMVLTLVGACRIIDTYDFNSVTNDEPLHIASGMQWLAEGRYTYEPKHPPLARVAAALGPFADR
jgi:hypothetical protein